MTLRRVLLTLAGVGAFFLVGSCDESFAQERSMEVIESQPIPKKDFSFSAPHPFSQPCPPTLDQLARMNWCELEHIYRQASAGNLPHGFGEGRIINCPQKPLAGLSNKLAGLWWRGKHFDAHCGTLINQWLVAKAIRAKVYYGHSHIDGQPSILMNYADSWTRWRNVRDEMREIAPGLYLGAMFLADAPEPKLWFVLQIHGR